MTKRCRPVPGMCITMLAIVLAAPIPAIASACQGNAEFPPAACSILPLLVLVLVLVLALLCGTLIVRRRLRAVIAAMEGIERGRLDSRSGCRHGRTGPGRLALAFDRMADALAKRDSERREGEERYRTLVENIDELIFMTDASGVFIYLSPALYKLGGYRQEEAVGRNFIDFVHPEDREITAGKFNELLMGKPGNVEFRVLVKSGAYRWVMSSSLSIVSEKNTPVIMGIMSDIHQRKIAEQALMRSEAELNSIISSTPDIIYRLDSRGAFTFVNDAVRRYGYEPESLLGTNVMDLVHPDDRETARHRIDERRTGPRATHTLEIRLFGSGRDSMHPARGDAHRVFLIHAEGLYINDEARKEFFIGTQGIARDITERRRSEKELRENERRLRMITDNMRDILTQMDTKGVYEYISPSFISLFGYDPAMAIGHSAFDLVEVIHPDDREAYVSRLKACLDSGTAASLQYRVKHRSGHHVWVETFGMPLLDEKRSIRGYAFTSRDITGRKRAEDALKESEERYRSIVENTHEGIIIIDSTYRIIFANERILEISGYNNTEQLGANFLDFVDDGFKAEVAARHLKRQRGEDVPSIYNASIIRKDGRKRNLEVQVSKITDVRGAPNYIVQLLDITERKEEEESRRKLEMQILQTQKLESLGVLAGGIAHDFNNILMAILGHADLALLELQPDAPERESIEEILKASHRAADLCRQMLAYSGKALFVLEDLKLNVLIDEMVHLLRASISKKAALTLNLPEDLPLIRGDATQIRQIIMNLITNASESLGDGRGSISITTGALLCSEEYLGEYSLGEGLMEGLYVTLEVTDTGCGMDPGTLERIFEPFFTTKFTGRGLGLAAVLGIVRGHRGAYRVYSEPGRGTTFKIALPALPGVEGVAKAPDRVESLAGGATGAAGSVMLVDDEESVRRLGQRMLERLGYDAVVAGDGREALELFRQKGDEIVCVILDLTMPNMDGVETYHELRAIREDVLVILSSGYTRQDVAERFSGRGLSGFIQKPYTLEGLGIELKRILNKGDGPVGSGGGTEVP
jgi:two-component system, cell cycle sensor histidine kinase and response regulator CckA